MSAPGDLVKIEGAALLLGVALVALWVVRSGGVSAAAAGAAKQAGAAAVGVADAAVSGAVGAVGATVGLPMPDETTTDPAVARWLIDNFGHLEASTWSSAWALIRGEVMASGSGTPPPAGSAVARAHPIAASPSAPVATGAAAPSVLSGPSWESQAQGGYQWSGFGLWGPSP